jgi:hypothetical protein
LKLFLVWGVGIEWASQTIYMSWTLDFSST